METEKTPFSEEEVPSTEINNSKKKDIENSLSYFDINKDDVDIEKDIIYDVKIPKDTKDKILKISRMIKIAVLSISGYEEVPEGGDDSSKFKLVKPPLASSEVIKTFKSLLEPYADESNLATKKDWDSFKVQALADWGAFYKLCLREKASPEQHERAVQRVFQGCLINIGEITCGNPDNMNKLFGSLNADYEENEGRNIFK